MTRKITLFIVILSCCTLAVSSGFSWGSLFFASDDETGQEDVHSDKTRKSQFELSTDQDRFILANSEYFDLPELDRCLHSAVERLSSSCRDTQEEELGKLTVWLYNCHAQSEGRTTFICTKGMTLAECTSPMSESAWGTYQTISNRARAFCYRMSQDQFAKKVEISVNSLTTSANNQMQSMHELQHITDVIMDQLDNRNEELKTQQIENADNYDHLKSIHTDTLTKVREKMSLDNDMYQQTFDRTLSFNRFIENMTHSVNLSAISQSIELAQLSKNIIQTHKQLLTFNTTLTRWFFQLADRINLQLSDIEGEAARLVKDIGVMHNDVINKNNQLLVLAQVLHTTLLEAEIQNNKKGTHMTAIPDHLTLSFLVLLLSLLLEPTRLMKFFVLLSTSLSSALYVYQPNTIYLSFSIILIPMLIICEQIYLWLFLGRKRNVVVDSRPNHYSVTKQHPVVNDTMEYPPFTTNFREHPIFELTSSSEPRDISPTGSVASSISNSFGIKCSAVTKSGARCRRNVTHGEHCNQHRRYPVDFS
ncbi:Protein brambleberry precursor [Oopsacas minuta]|uniref:Protein brambleberry n=1 Tax=Oopsacas minuta TaxID=111878 RepID=A0AAV7K3S6_9METZ|nr:Protein brambleberry precursor [Oopsacas minuta]